MKNLLSLQIIITTVLLLGCSFMMKVDAAVVTITVTGTVNFSDGSYSDLTTSDTFSGIFTYDTDEAQATAADTDGSTDPGHEYSSFYDFDDPYGANVTHTQSGGSFNSVTDPLGSAGVVVNNDMFLEGGVGSLVAEGTYDWIEILGANTVDGSGGYPSDGEEWTLALFANTGWFTDGTLIPDDIASSYTAVMVAAEFDATEAEIGFLLVEIDTIDIQGIPEPSSLLMVFIGIMGLVMRRIRTRQG